MQPPVPNDEARSVAVVFENRIRNDELETGVLIEPDGTVIVERQDKPDEVAFRVAELRRARDGTFTHNHPRDSTFSKRDVQVAAQWNLRELRVVTSTCLYVMQSIAGLWLPIKTHYASAHERAKAEVHDLCRQGPILQSDAWRCTLHLAWERLGKDIGRYYERDPT
jgi:hypothetical protein